MNSMGRVVEASLLLGLESILGNLEVCGGLLLDLVGERMDLQMRSPLSYCGTDPHSPITEIRIRLLNNRFEAVP